MSPDRYEPRKIRWDLDHIDSRLQKVEKIVEVIPELRADLEHLQEGLTDCRNSLDRNTKSNDSLRNALLTAALSFAFAAIMFVVGVTLS